LLTSISRDHLCTRALRGGHCQTCMSIVHARAKTTSVMSWRGRSRDQRSVGPSRLSESGSFLTFETVHPSSIHAKPNDIIGPFHQPAQSILSAARVANVFGSRLPFARRGVSDASLWAGYTIYSCKGRTELDTIRNLYSLFCSQ
jgi:hypothetical protein